MNLVKTDGRNFTAICLSCGERMTAGDGSECYADLHGKPFEAYYCGHCARMVDPEHALARVTDYLAGEVARVQRIVNHQFDSGLRQRIYDATDAAVIIMARRADMALERRRRLEAQ